VSSDKKIPDLKNKIIKKYQCALIEEKILDRKRSDFTSEFKDKIKIRERNKISYEQFENAIKCCKDFKDEKTKMETKLPTALSVGEVKCLLKNMIFVVNSPNEKALGDIIKMKINDELNLIDSAESFAALLQVEILSWFKEKESKFLSYREAKQKIANLRSDLYSFAFMGSTKNFINQFEACKANFKQTVLDEIEIENFLFPSKDEAVKKKTRKKSKQNNLFIYHGGSLFLMSLKVYQILSKHFPNVDNGYIFDDLSYLFGGWMLDRVDKALTNLIIISCDASKSPLDSEKFTKLLTNLMKVDNKKIILICKEKDILISMLPKLKDCKFSQAKSESLTDLTPKSQKKVL